MLDVRCATLGSSSNMRIRVEVRSALREMFQMICTEHLLVLEGRLICVTLGLSRTHGSGCDGWRASAESRHGGVCLPCMLSTERAISDELTQRGRAVSRHGKAKMLDRSKLVAFTRLISDFRDRYKNYIPNQDVSSGGSGIRLTQPKTLRAQSSAV